MRKIARLIICLCITLFVISCSWEKPEKISVRTNASYNFSIGKLEKSLDELIDIKSILSSDNEQLSVYDYFPGKSDTKVQQFLLTVKVFDLPLKDVEIGGGQVLSTCLSAIPDGTMLNLENLSAYGVPALEVTGKQELDFNPSEILDSMKETLGDDFSNKVTFASIPVYLYFNVNEGLSADAKMKFYYGLRDGSKTPISPNPYDFYVAGSTSEYSTINNVAMPELSEDSELSAVIINLEDESFSITKDIAQVMNDARNVSVENAQLCLDYDLRVKGNISKEKITNGSAKLSVYAAIAIPIKFNVLDEIKMDLRSLIGTDENQDIFNRTEPTGLNEMMEYLEAIRSVALYYNTEATPVTCTPSIKFGVDMLGNGEYNNYSISEGSFILDYDTVQEMFETYPLCPNLKLIAQKDSVLTLPRKKNVKMNMSICILTDGTVKLF